MKGGACLLERGWPPSFLPFFLSGWIATGDRGCKTIFNSPLIMNPLMNAPPSLHSRAYLRGSFSSRDLAVYTRTSTSEVNDDGLPGSRATASAFWVV